MENLKIKSIVPILKELGYTNLAVEKKNFGIKFNKDNKEYFIAEFPEIWSLSVAYPDAPLGIRSSSRATKSFKEVVEFVAKGH